MAELKALQQRTEQLMREPLRLEQDLGPEAAPTTERFSVFRPADLQRALDFADRWMAIASIRGGTDGLDDSLADAERIRQREDPDLVEHALLVFLTHYPEALQLPIPALIERHPGLFEERGISLTADLGDAEDVLAYWREDPLANQHHEHWHVVYPAQGVPSGGGRFVTKKRHGELFVYMHQQMLARYDAERLSLGLDVAASYGDYRTPLSEGYDPHIAGYGSRPSQSNPFDVVPEDVTAEEARRKTVEDALTAGRLADGTTVSTDSIGSLIEASGDRLDSEHGGLHNMGHIMIAALTVGGDNVMRTPQTAIMDPVFFRWHRHIDDLTEEAAVQTPRDFSDAPPVTFAPAGGVLLCFTGAIPSFEPGGLALQSWAEERFGGSKWSESSDPALTDQLETFMTNADTMGPRPYLDHRDFAYVFRLENTSIADVDVTLRVFAVPETWADDRRMWIELDKLPATAPAGGKVVVTRWGGDSSVVQREQGSGRPPHPRRDPAIGRDGGFDPAAAKNYCNCGWPFHLLLPRGTSEGLAFRLAVIATDAEKDLQSHDATKCGSLSFCGARDVEYPDRRPMGYPFDRPFANSSVTAALGRLPNVALRSFSIKHTS